MSVEETPLLLELLFDVLVCGFVCLIVLAWVWQRGTKQGLFFLRHYLQSLNTLFCRSKNPWIWSFKCLVVHNLSFPTFDCMTMMRKEMNGEEDHKKVHLITASSYDDFSHDSWANRLIYEANAQRWIACIFYKLPQKCANTWQDEDWCPRGSFHNSTWPGAAHCCCCFFCQRARDWAETLNRVCHLPI